MWGSIATLLTLAIPSRDEGKTQHAAERRSATFAAGCESFSPTYAQVALLVIPCDGYAMIIQYRTHGTRFARWKRCTRTTMHFFSKNVQFGTETVFEYP